MGVAAASNAIDTRARAVLCKLPVELRERHMQYDASCPLNCASTIFIMVVLSQRCACSHALDGACPVFARGRDRTFHPRGGLCQPCCVDLLVDSARMLAEAWYICSAAYARLRLPAEGLFTTCVKYVELCSQSARDCDAYFGALDAMNDGQQVFV